MSPTHVPRDVQLEARRLGESITPTREQRPVKAPEHDALAREELRVVREVQMFAATRYGDQFAAKLRVSFRYVDGKTETRVSLDRPPARGPALTVAQARKQLEQTLKGRSS